MDREIELLNQIRSQEIQLQDMEEEYRRDMQQCSDIIDELGMRHQEFERFINVKFEAATYQLQKLEDQSERGRLLEAMLSNYVDLSRYASSYAADLMYEKQEELTKAFRRTEDEQEEKIYALRREYGQLFDTR